MASSSFTLPRWFGGKKKSKETYRIQEEGDESIYQNIGDDGGPDYSKRALPRTPSEEERLFSPPPTLGDVVKARARLRKTVSVDEGIGYNVAAWNRYAVSRGAIHQLLSIILKLRILVLLPVSTMPYVVKVKNYS
jgi:hypothetical protein